MQIITDILEYHDVSSTEIEVKCKSKLAEFVEVCKPKESLIESKVIKIKIKYKFKTNAKAIKINIDMLDIIVVLE